MTRICCNLATNEFSNYEGRVGRALKTLHPTLAQELPCTTGSGSVAGARWRPLNIPQARVRDKTSLSRRVVFSVVKAPVFSKFYVYVIFRPDGSPCYVGKGSGGRFAHRGEHNVRLKRLIGKYGDLPKLKVREDLTESDAFAVEVALIAAMGREPQGPLLNRTDGGEGPSGCVHSREVVERVSAKNRGKKRTPEFCAAVSARQRNQSAEVRAKIGAASKARRAAEKQAGIKRVWTISEEQRLVIRAKHTGKIMPRAGVEAGAAKHRGLKHTKETRATMSAVRLGRKRSSESVEKGAAKIRGRQAPSLGTKMSAEICARKKERWILRRASETYAAYIEKHAAARRGLKMSDEARANMKAAWVLRRAKSASKIHGLLP